MTERQSAVLEPAAAPEPAKPTHQWWRRDPWALGVFAGAFVVLLAASLHLIGQIGLSGDEPWYLLQGYALLHFHTVDVARVVHDPALFRQFLGMLGLYRQMLLDARQGLIPWAPLVALAPVGLALLWRGHTREAALAVAWTLGLLIAFASSAIAPHVNQAYALPARFTAECQPYLALGAAAVFARGWPALRAALDTARHHGAALALRTRVGRLSLALALGCLALLAMDAWCTLVGELAPALLYPTANGSMRLLAAYPHLLPGWWFAIFGGYA